MAADSDSCCSPPGRDGAALPIISDPGLVGAGWVRRHMVDAARAAESAELYASMGFEVKVQKLTPADFDPHCAACAESACSAYVVVYTRRRDSDTGAT